MDEEHVEYQRSLRAIGMYLDGQAASYVRVVEVPDGFSVQYHRDSPGGPVESVTLSHSDLARRSHTGIVARLRRRPMRAARHGPAPLSYEDFFRAVGYELEEAVAFGILLDELDDGYLLTYQYYNPDTSFLLHKHQVHLLHDDISAIAKTAKMRRGRAHRKLEA